MRSVVWYGIPFLIAVTAACNDQPAGPGTTTLVVIQAPSGAGAPGWELIDTLKVQVQDGAGHPRAGVEVTWTIREGGGSIAPLSGESDAGGFATAVWTLGPNAGQNVARASEPVGDHVDFHSTGEALKVDHLVSQWGIGCGLIEGSIWCWGDYFWGRGDPVSHSNGFGWGDYGPEQVMGGPAFVKLSASSVPMACGLDVQAAVWCATSDSRQLTAVGGLPPMRTIMDAGFARHCGLAVADSTPWCWGVDRVPTHLAGIPALTTMRIEDNGVDFAACGLRADSMAVCWGHGPLGDGSTGDSPTAVAVSGGHRFVELTVAYGHASCGRTASREMWCWGRGSDLVLEPILVFSGAEDFATWAQMVQVLAAGGEILRWEGADQGPLQALTGLAGLPIVRMSANNNVACLQQVDGQVNCFDEMFENSSAPGWWSYSPVQPLRRNPQFGKGAD